MSNDVKSEVKEACNILRRDDGTSSVNDYMEQLSWLMFLKIFEGIEKQQEEIASLKGEKYEPVIEPKFRWSNWANKDWIGKPRESLKEFVEDVDTVLKVIGKQDNTVIYFIDNVLFPYLKGLKGSPEKEKIAQLFLEIKGNKVRSAYNLMDVIDKLKGIDPNNYEDTHVLSQFYEELLLNMGSEAGWSGEYYTPRPVVRFIVKAVDPNFKDKILDPFVGSGGFLIESYKHISAKLGNSMTKHEYEKLQNNTFYGIEKKPLPYLIGTMNLILHGLLKPNIVRRNTLQEDVHNVSEDDKFSVILTNPPFGGEENKNVQSNFLYPVQATEALALQYIMKKLADDGKVGMVLPEGQIMFGSGKFMEIRKELLEKFNVTAVVSVPQGVFSSMGAGVKTCLLFFQKDGNPTKEIWYYELEGKFTKKKTIKDEHFEDVLKKIKTREISDNSWIVPIDEIKNNNYDLTPKNPNKKEEFEFIEPKDLLEEIETLNYEIDKIMKEIREVL